MKNLLIVLAATLGIVGFRAATDAGRDPSGAIVTSGALAAFEVRVGDCFNDTAALADGGDDRIDDLPAVPCSVPHDNEVFAVFDLDLERFPSEEEMSQIALDACIEHFEMFVGIDYQTSVLDVMTLYPTAESWKRGNDREVVCAVYDMTAEKLVGSVRGSKI